eukprot:Awhi_evm2s2210
MSSNESKKKILNYTSFSKDGKSYSRSIRVIDVDSNKSLKPHQQHLEGKNTSHVSIMKPSTRKVTDLPTANNDKYDSNNKNNTGRRRFWKRKEADINESLKLVEDRHVENFERTKKKLSPIIKLHYFLVTVAIFVGFAALSVVWVFGVLLRSVISETQGAKAVENTSGSNFWHTIFLEFLTFEELIVLTMVIIFIVMCSFGIIRA